MNNDANTQRELSVVTWKDVRDDVLKVNKELGKIIDAISPGDNYKFVKAAYLYGDVFIKHGEAQFSINNDLTPLSHHSVDKEIQKELLYSPMPLFLILGKSNEFFFDTGKRIVPVNLFNKGSLSGIYEAMDYMMGRKPEPIWNFSAGSRSIFMLPKITDKSGFKKLHMAYSLPNTIRINKLSDHWETFKHIVQSKNFTQNWQSTILFFGRKWLDNKNNSKEWSKFKDYLFHIIWDHANYAIDKVKFNVNWESFAEAISLRRLQPKPYLIDQMRHLLSVVAGNFPAFAVMDNSQEAAPTDLLQNIFVESYGLKQYLPTLMYACMPQNGATKPRYVYYSLSMPTVLEGSPLKKTTSTIVSDLREIKLLIETLKNHHAFKANKIIQNTVIDYFHYEKDMCGQVKTSDSIPIEDDSFLKDQNIFPSRNFCATSPFFSGCIRIKV
jgi:hypothetical protein